MDSLGRLLLRLLLVPLGYVVAVVVATLVIVFGSWRLGEAKALVKLLAGIPAKINLIPFNPWPGSRYECSDWEQIEKFSEIIFNAGYASPVRTPRGRDILAACGQLKSASEKLSARERLALRAMAMTD